MTDQADIVFDATVTAIKNNLKVMPYGGPTTASLDVTLHVERPGLPKEPKNYNSPEPSKDDFDKTASYKAALKRWEKGEKEHAAAVGKYARAAEVLRSRLVGYAALAGVISVLAGNVVRVEIFPGEQHLLPGFGLELLAAPEETSE